MNAPYDGDRGRSPVDGAPVEDGSQPPEDPYVRDAYARDPYGDRAPAAQDPVGDALYDRAAHPPPPPGSVPDPQALYQQPEPAPHAPDPQLWAPTPAPEPEGPARHLPYGDTPYGREGATVQFTGVDGLLTGERNVPRGAQQPQAPQAPQDPQSQPAPGPYIPGPQEGQDDAFAYLFRDQGQPPQEAPYDPRQGQVQGPGQGQNPAQGQGPGPGWEQGDARQHADAFTPPHPRPESGSGSNAGAGTPPGPPAAHPNPPRGPVPTTAADPAPSPEAEAAAAPGSAPTPAPAGPASPPEPPAGTGGGDDGDSGGGGGRSGGLLRSSAIMAAGTMVSRLTGFLRSAMIVAAIGAASLGDTYQLAITLPTMLYVLTVGGGLNSVFVPQLVRAMKEDDDGGEGYANRLLTLVAVILGLLSVVAVLAAPLLVRMMSVSIASDPAANAVATAFVRYCLPSIFFMGIHVVMGQILNARGRFGPMMWTPVLNNIVIMASVGAFLWVYGTADHSELTTGSIPPEAVRLLGVGTLLGLTVQALSMIPFLRASGFRVRPRFDWRGAGLGKAAKLAKWTVFFVLANQAGNLVVMQLSTWAQNAAGPGHPGSGYTAYSQAQLVWNMPQAIITVSVMAALLPRLSRAANDGDAGAVRDDISQGLRNSAVAIVPIAFGFVALGIPMCTMIYGSSGLETAQSMGHALMAFGVGLIPFSVQYVVLRAFYAYEDTRTPFFNTVIIAVVNAAASAACFLLLPARWAVVGMAGSYGLAYIVGVGVAWRRLRIRLGGDLDGSRVLRTYIRLAGAAVPATLVSGAVAYGVTQGLGSGTFGSVAAVVAGGIALGVAFVLAAKRMRIEEMTAMVGMVRARLGR